MKTIKAADLFCGAGGSSTGLKRVADSIGVGLDLTAVNHWPVAVETHAANQFAGTRTDAVKQIGNAVEVNQAAALWAHPVDSVLGIRRAA